jgi:FtsH-binding integral membrane protein
VRRSDEPSVLPVWFILGLLVPLFLLVRAADEGRVVLTPFQEFALVNGLLLGLLINTVLGGITIGAGRTAAWLPTLISLVGLGLWGYAAIERSTWTLG